MRRFKAGSNKEKKADEPENPSSYECNICFDSAKDPVVTMCGHLFCWSCLHQWLESGSSNRSCPVCKSAVDREKVIPVYSRGATNDDPRSKAPPRPHGHRTEPSNTNSWFGNPNIQMRLGIGAFPFGFFASTSVGNAQGERTVPHRDDQFLSNVFLFVAIFFIFWLLLM